MRSCSIRSRVSCNPYPAWWNASVAWVQAKAPALLQFYTDTKVGQAVSSAVEGKGDAMVDIAQYLGQRAVSAGAGVLSGVAALLFWVVSPIYFAFFLMTDTSKIDKLERHIPFLKKETSKDVVYLFQEFLNIIVAFFRGQLIIAFLQGLLFAIGFTIVGLKYGFVIGLTLGFLNIVPYLGNILGLGTALPLAFFQDGGGLMRVLAVLIVFACVQIDRGLLPHAQDHGRPHRAPPDGHHPRGLLLGRGAQRHHGDGPRHPADRVSGGLLAAGEGEVHARTRLKVSEGGPRPTLPRTHKSRGTVGWALAHLQGLQPFASQSA